MSRVDVAIRQGRPTVHDQPVSTVQSRKEGGELVDSHSDVEWFLRGEARRVEKTQAEDRQPFDHPDLRGSTASVHDRGVMIPIGRLPPLPDSFLVGQRESLRVPRGRDWVLACRRRTDSHRMGTQVGLYRARTAARSPAYDRSCERSR